MVKLAIKAVYDDDLESYLSSLGVLNAVKAGKIKCFSCASTITLSNLLAVFPDADGVGMSCNNSKCLEALERRSEVPGGNDV